MVNQGRFCLQIFLGLCVIAVLTNISEAKVNCRKFVYAPVCRGVAAKRAFPTTLEKKLNFYIPDSKFDSDLPDVEYTASSPENLLLVRGLLQGHRGGQGPSHLSSATQQAQQLLPSQTVDQFYDYE
ncbi:uncharacterized protein LOC111043329 isoform X4 [Nilaparvata lugens]|uniref:uncharacterized protein LOC111043329 isoform X3 n=1 Tax=Nilaparvata lugens TaxID=108931 RepID=UPI00193E7719|nr:uncharacterized protein LOC111043329 isoform X3 [Nilaparvata lugens]XP_039280892.1 uncharacterized protein LOC111043329 isoform X4 [Nilaparvata lugens]